MTLENCFRGLAELTRIRIINLLLHGELCGCDIQRLLSTPQPYVSRHLVYLKHSGLVEDRREGFRVFYRLTRGKQEDRLFKFLRQALQDEEVFLRDAQRVKQAIAAGDLSSRANRAVQNSPQRSRRKAAGGL